MLVWSARRESAIPRPFLGGGKEDAGVISFIHSFIGSCRRKNVKSVLESLAIQPLLPGFSIGQSVMTTDQRAVPVQVHVAYSCLPYSV